MPFTILLTGFGPFPGAPYNPTGTLVNMLARRRDGTHRIAHIFATSYAAVDRDLPALLSRTQPDALVMFGLAQRTKHLRIETVARNALSLAHADVSGVLPAASEIAPGGPASMRLRAPGRRLMDASLKAGVTAALSRDAGSYLCNYLCWRASEAAQAPRAPRLVAFVHVPNVSPVRIPASPRRRGPPATVGDLAKAGEAIVQAALTSLRR
jgi:pyroglutamyl-peptidase